MKFDSKKSIKSYSVSSQSVLIFVDDDWSPRKFEYFWTEKEKLTSYFTAIRQVCGKLREMKFLRFSTELDHKGGDWDKNLSHEIVCRSFLLEKATHGSHSLSLTKKYTTRSWKM